jgi:uncharacterized integral membrane protein
MNDAREGDDDVETHVTFPDSRMSLRPFWSVLLPVVLLLLLLLLLLASSTTHSTSSWCTNYQQLVPVASTRGPS